MHIIVMASLIGGHFRMKLSERTVGWEENTTKEESN